MKFGQIVYNHNRKVKFEGGLCPLIFKATAVKKTVRNDENQPLQENFSTYKGRSLSGSRHFVFELSNFYCENRF